MEKKNLKKQKSRKPRQKSRKPRQKSRKPRQKSRKQKGGFKSCRGKKSASFSNENHSPNYKVNENYVFVDGKKVYYLYNESVKKPYYTTTNEDAINIEKDKIFRKSAINCKKTNTTKEYNMLALAGININFDICEKNRYYPCYYYDQSETDKQNSHKCYDEAGDIFVYVN